MNPGLLQFAHVKDSRWLTLEVCREFQRSKCLRSEADCKYAHPPAHVEVQNGRVVCCYDFIKGKCKRKEPPCKYLHPPQHLCEQLLQNGRNNLIIKNIQMQMLSQTLAASGQLLPITAPFIGGSIQAPAVATAPSYPSYLSAAGLPLLGDTAALFGAPPPPPPPPPQSQAAVQVPISNGGLGSGIASVAGSIKLDNRENFATVAYGMPHQLQHQHQQPAEELGAKKRKLAELNEDSQHQRLQMLPMCLPSAAGSLPTGFPGSLPGGKRAAVADSKSGIPVYQPSAASYQQLAAFQVPSPQSHTTGAYIPTSWTGDLFQEAACPALTFV